MQSTAQVLLKALPSPAPVQVRWCLVKDGKKSSHLSSAPAKMYAFGTLSVPDSMRIGCVFFSKVAAF
jgi:hypothetical protein